MTELERILEENERLRTENAYLKKLRELRLMDEALLWFPSHSVRTPQSRFSFQSQESRTLNEGFPDCHEFRRKTKIEKILLKQVIDVYIKRRKS